MHIAAVEKKFLRDLEDIALPKSRGPRTPVKALEAADGQQGWVLRRLVRPEIE